MITWLDSPKISLPDFTFFGGKTLGIETEENLFSQMHSQHLI
jgi:hypothetical protein